MVRRLLGLALVFCMFAIDVPRVCAAQEEGFPFDGELILDAAAMPGSKRIPVMTIAENGSTVIEMWCNRVTGQLVVAGDTITVMIGQPTQRNCAPDRAQADAQLMDALNGATNWRRQGDIVTLTGPTTLRFRVPTN